MLYEIGHVHKQAVSSVVKNNLQLILTVRFWHLVKPPENLPSKYKYGDTPS